MSVQDDLLQLGFVLTPQGYRHKVAPIVLRLRHTLSGSEWSAYHEECGYLRRSRGFVRRFVQPHAAGLAALREWPLPAIEHEIAHQLARDGDCVATA